MEEPTTPRATETYLVLAEFKDPDTRAKLSEKLRTYPGFCPLTNTTWAIRSKESVSDIRDNLREAVGEQDRLYVFRSGHSGAWLRAISQKHSDWLKKYL